uniref:Uncharacterized protein n=1 Tax=Magnetococcus massalia (strain MO-1) TaxID=451514 RepID=A0A1S7LG85_MAGMO|nr:protein of unknown function [Candidatus Magnetococcus massalia]
MYQSVNLALTYTSSVFALYSPTPNSSLELVTGHRKYVQKAKREMLREPEWSKLRDWVREVKRHERRARVKGAEGVLRLPERE